MTSRQEASPSHKCELGRRSSNEEGPVASHPHYIPQIRKWIDACNSSHGEICVAKPISQRQPADVPLWLIDTHQQCIVPGTSADHYLALSYVWPHTREPPKPEPVSYASALEELQAQLVRLTKGALPLERTPRSLLLDASNLDDLQVPGALASAVLASTLPGVVQHALGLTIAMGERYLWVDRLCILQNNKDTLSEVAKMDQVYSGAYMTIIAAAPAWMYEEDSDQEWTKFESFRQSGRRFSPEIGLYRTDHSVLTPIHPLEMSEEEVVFVMSHRYRALSGSRWATRGWTYQEQILCKRAAVFTETGIFWDCQCSMWDGVDLVPGQSFSNLPLRADMGRRFATRWWPDFGFYLDMICPYNGREFSYPQDGLSGISGVLNALERSFPGGFIWGMPSLFLDHALLWQPFGVAERRADLMKNIGTPAESEDDSDVPSFPLWAWCGWQCFVDPWSLRSGLASVHDREHLERSGSWRTRNLVEWRISRSPSQSDELQEATEFDFHVTLGSFPDFYLPEGWTYHEKSTMGQPYFVHKEDQSTHFRHPIPLGDKSSKRPYSSTPEYLIANLKKTSFVPATILDHKSSMSFNFMAISKLSVFEDQIFSLGPRKPSPIMVLMQPSGAFAGLIRLMTEVRLEPTESLQLVAISTGSANAEDLASSLEWKAFERGEVHYRKGNRSKTDYFHPQWLSDFGKRALMYTLDMAFDERSAGDAAMERKLSEGLTKVAKGLQLKSKAYSDRDKPISSDTLADLWFEARTETLREQSKKRPYSTASSKDVICEFYNVLWVETKNGVSYRRACGWVPKHIWEAHATGPIEVKLG